MYYIQHYIKFVSDTDVCVFVTFGYSDSLHQRYQYIRFACFPLTVNIFSLIRFIF